MNNNYASSASQFACRHNTDNYKSHVNIRIDSVTAEAILTFTLFDDRAANFKAEKSTVRLSPEDQFRLLRNAQAEEFILSPALKTEKVSDAFILHHFYIGGLIGVVLDDSEAQIFLDLMGENCAMLINTAICGFAL